MSTSDVLVAGINATQDGLAAMKAGDLAVTVLQDAAGQGAGGIDAALKLARKEAVEQKVYIPFQLVTPANMADFAAANGRSLHAAPFVVPHVTLGGNQMSDRTSAEAPANAPAPFKWQVPQSLNALIGLVAVALIFEALIFEALGWLVRDQSFLFNTQRLSFMILQVSVVGIVNGVTQVILTGGVDLSSGSIVGGTAMIVMSLTQVSTFEHALNPSQTDLPVIVPLAAGLAVGAVVGIVNGALTA